LRGLRRTVALIALFAALLGASAATAALQPIRRTFGDLTLPRVRTGTLHIPAGHASGRVRVIARLQLPPLAAAPYRLASLNAESHLNVSSASSQRYLARVDAAQRVAVAELRRAIPQARISRRFHILLDGLTVDLPARKLPQLVRLPFVTRVYPSSRYTLDLNESPAIIGADVFQAETGLHGDGVKIAVVDDGIDQTNPFFNPSGYTFPAGFPKGNTKFTSAKVIVARAFPAPGTGAAAELPLDRNASFHGTHVAGIAAGNAGTNAPAGRDHPAVDNLSGVAPRAYLGNYRVFSVPTPVGEDEAFTPEIVAAFESAVADGMNVINFSGGGPQTDPANDPMVETIRNVVNAGVVPVISAGNDRDDWGLGSVGTPGTAPDAITVAAVTNKHVFTTPLTVDAPTIVGGQTIPFVSALGNQIPTAWANPQQLVDISTITGTDGKPVDPLLCGIGGNPDTGISTLPPGSLTGAIALVSRGTCSIVGKAERARAAGAVGIVYVDNRAGDANPFPVVLPIPGGTIADLDGQDLRTAMAATGGRATIRISRTIEQIETGRSGIPTSFSSAGPTPFDHLLKPDISAPGEQILSSTLPEFAGSPFAVLDGTSMSAPHISGAVALLVELHPTWTPGQIKSALMDSAVPAAGNTARTTEASVLLEGAGLANLPGAADPRVFTAPQSLSYGDLNVSKGAARAAQLVTVSDAGGGAGTWQVELRPQSASAGADLELPTSIALPPGGTAELPVTASASASATPGDDYGFVVLTNGNVSRRIPYDFSVTRPGLATVQPIELKDFQLGQTVKGVSHANVYRYPTAPFGPAPNYTGAPMDENGAEQLYVTHLNEPAANLGVSVLLSSAGSLIDPFFLGSPDENDVQGYAGTPVNANGLMFDYRADVETAGAFFPRQKAYYVAVDSPRDDVTGQSFPGSYILRAWINDVTPPTLRLLTTRVGAGRPTIVARSLDFQSGVDPLSLVIAYKQRLVGAAAYDPVSGLAIFPLPAGAPSLTPGRTPGTLLSSDLQETKNISTNSVLPNTNFKPVRLTVVNGPATTWLLPDQGSCAAASTRLLVVASSPKKLQEVRFFDGSKPIATVTQNLSGLFAATWRTKGAAVGKHRLLAETVDAGGAHQTAVRVVRVCKK
jgi:subtilisin family serine protease